MSERIPDDNTVVQIVDICLLTKKKIEFFFEE